MPPTSRLVKFQLLQCKFQDSLPLSAASIASLTRLLPAMTDACSQQTSTKLIAAEIAFSDSVSGILSGESRQKRMWKVAATRRIWPLALLKRPLNSSSRPHINSSCFCIASCFSVKAVHVLRSFQVRLGGVEVFPVTHRLVRSSTVCID